MRKARSSFSFVSYSFFSENILLSLQMWACAMLYLVDSTVKKGSREVESLLGTNWPVAAQIQSIDEYNTFFPALWIQSNFSSLFISSV